MPDSFGFTHEPHFGTVYHRCIECDEYPWGCIVPEDDRRKHHERHVRARKREQARAQRANLAKARRVLRQTERENARAYREEV